ncbi:MAG: Holliday junction resolvase [Euryarchaeota archaeon]|nr:Holliday junction resolvase [Euryarchaeota archaeon]
MTSQYERELRHVLAGIPAGVEAVIRSCSTVEKQRMRLVIQRPFLVVRAAGSGIEGSGDLLALRGDISFPIEVKTTKSKKIYLSGRTLEQYNALVYEGERCGLMPLYAHRLKGVRGDSWRIFRVETSTLEGRLRVLARRIPPLPKTRKNRAFIDWDQGMPLNEFINIVCQQNQHSPTLEYIQKRSTTDAMPREVSEVKTSILDELQRRRTVLR